MGALKYRGTPRCLDEICDTLLDERLITHCRVIVVGCGSCARCNAVRPTVAE